LRASKAIGKEGIYPAESYIERIATLGATSSNKAAIERARMVDVDVEIPGGTM